MFLFVFECLFLRIDQRVVYFACILPFITCVYAGVRGLLMMSEMSDISISQSFSQSQSPPKRSLWNQSYPTTQVAVSPIIPPARRKRGASPRAQTPAMLRRRISFLETQMSTTGCPRQVDTLLRSWASASIRLCSRCGLNHRKVELSRIGMAVYGDNHLESRTRWINDGIDDYIERIKTACDGSAVVDDIRDDLSHVETHVSGSKIVLHKSFGL